MPDPHLSPRLELAIAVAREAGEIALKFFRKEGLEVELKGDQSPVTIADRTAEEHIRQRVAAEFPHDGILGEEHGEVEGTSGFRWILDPVDGTKSFVRGTPQWGTMVGIEHDGEAVVGVCLIPVLGELYYAAQGQGAFEVRGSGPPKPIHVSKISSLDKSLFCTTAVSHFEKFGRLEAYDKLRRQVLLDRTWGDVYGYMLVASGRAEIMIDPKLAVWDCAAVQPILTEAGGCYTDWNGKPTIHGGDGVATNGLVHDVVIAITSKYERKPAS